MRTMLAALITVLGAGCSVVGLRDGTEEPTFTVLDHVGDIEIRQYGAQVAAETTIDGNEAAARGAGFRRLAGYIFGDNSGTSKIAMTAPVAQSSETIAMTAPVGQSQDEAGRWVIRFTMPASATLATLPVPNNKLVRLIEVAPATYGVLRFSGFAGVEAVAERRAVLVQALQTGMWRSNGTPVAWFYDPPWALPFFRRNEVAVPVSHR